MAGIGPQISPATVFPNFDQGLGRAKKSVDFQQREAYVLGTLGVTGQMFSTAFVASQPNSTVQGYYVCPGRVKIPKLVVFFSALTAAALSAASFNIVVGTGAYAQGSIAGNDNSSVPNVAYNALGQPSGTGPNAGSVPYPAGGGGICSNPAVAGNAMFAADVVFNAANFPLIALATGSGPTYGVTLIPSSPDAVYPNGAVLTLRYTTAAVGTVSNFIVAGYIEPQPLQATAPGQNYPPYVTPVPGVDF